MGSQPNDTQEASSSTSQSEKKEEQVDIKVLAEEVYALLKKEMRIEQERSGRHKN